MFEFHWRVPVAGFEWVRARRPKNPGHAQEEETSYLVAIGDTGRFDARKPGGLVEYRTYEPGAALFRGFADLPATPEAIRNFANQWGALGGATLKAVEGRGNGQPFWFWRDSILGMKHMVAIWDAVKRGDSAFLSQFVKWTEPNGAGRTRFTYSAPTPLRFGMTLAPHNAPPEIAAILMPGDSILPARIGNQTHLNDMLSFSTLMPKLAWDRDHGKPRERIHFTPGDLISALWVQFARAVEGNLEYSQCDQCRSWFEIAGDRRADARFCSDKCRFRAYRGRQKEARRLHSAGVSPKDIAKQLGSDTKTVEKWISSGAD